MCNLLVVSMSLTFKIMRYFFEIIIMGRMQESIKKSFYL